MSNELQLACEKGDMNKVLALTSQDDVDINACGEDGLTPFLWACYGGHTTVVDFLVRAGCSTNARSTNGYTGLHCACFNGHANLIPCLLELGLDLNDNGNDVGTPLEHALLNGYTNCVQALIQAGCALSEENLRDDRVIAALQRAQQ